MKKIFSLILLLAVLSACKSRKLHIEENTVTDKTITKDSSSVVNTVSDSKIDTSKTVKESEDKSGTWIWEEWYHKDLGSDSVITPGAYGKLAYKKTTFIQTDKKEKTTIDNAIFENHSEIKDSIGVKEEKKDLVVKTKTRDLDAKQDGKGWVWALVGVCLIVIASGFIVRR